MKYRESGMPNEQLWNTFFDFQLIFNQMGISKEIRTLIDIGCGYGTFLIPSAKIIAGTVIGIDIENEMIEACKMKIQEQNIKNVSLICGDISTQNTIKHLEKYIGSIDYITLFNILHCEEPLTLLKNVYNIIDNKGKIGVIHWKYENTPRGPSMEIRPTYETIINWATKAGFSLERYVELPPYHYGLVFIKNHKENAI